MILYIYTLYRCLFRSSQLKDMSQINSRLFFRKTTGPGAASKGASIFHGPCFQKTQDSHTRWLKSTNRPRKLNWIIIIYIIYIYIYTEKETPKQVPTYILSLGLFHPQKGGAISPWWLRGNPSHSGSWIGFIRHMRRMGLECLPTPSTFTINL